MKKTMRIVFVFLLAVCLVPITHNAAQGSEPTPSYKGLYLSIGGGSLGGVWYSLAGGAAELIQQNLPGSVATAQATGAAVENLRLLGDREVQIGISDTITDFNAWNGNPPFSAPFKNFSRIGPAIQPTFQMVVSDKSITKWSELNNKRIAVGGAGSSTVIAAEQVYPLMGVTNYKSEVVGYEPGANALREGKVDAVWQLGAYPFPTIAELASTIGVRLLPITAEEGKNISVKYPYYQPVTIPANTYPGQDQDIPSLCFQASFYVLSDMDPNIVYNITKALYSKEGLEFFTKITQNMAYIDKKFLLEWTSAKSSVPLHPGAKKFYDELSGK